MLIHSASQLITLSGGPQRGRELGRLGIIADGAVLIRDGEIIAVGATADLRAQYPKESEMNVSGRVVMPGFVDAHTHVMWAGDRAAEFEMRLEGKSYLEILEAGGGILSTVKETRAASLGALLSDARSRLRRMFNHGTTTVESKTGYGLDFDTELRMLSGLYSLDDEGPWELALTFLGAHAIPSEYAGRADEYIDHVREMMLPALKQWQQTNMPQKPLPFVDVFCETGAFNLEQSHRLLKTAGELGFPIKIHADEFENLGGTKMAVKLNAASADHLVSLSRADIKALGKSDTVAVGLPATPFGLGQENYMPAQEILKANGLLAVASDLNPGTAWGESMQFVLALACRYMKLTPAQAIAASTINAAAAIQRADRIGSIEAGKQADLLVLAVPDYRHLGYRFGTNLVETVIKKGGIYPVKQ